MAYANNVGGGPGWEVLPFHSGHFFLCCDGAAAVHIFLGTPVGNCNRRAEWMRMEASSGGITCNLGRAVGMTCV